MYLSKENLNRNMFYRRNNNINRFVFDDIENTSYYIIDVIHREPFFEDIVLDLKITIYDIEQFLISLGYNIEKDLRWLTVDNINNLIQTMEKNPHKFKNVKGVDIRVIDGCNFEKRKR